MVVVFTGVFYSDFLKFLFKMTLTIQNTKYMKKFNKEEKCSSMQATRI